MATKYPDIRDFLDAARLGQYVRPFMEQGFDDVEFLVNEIGRDQKQMDLLVQQTGLKPGHLMKLHVAISSLRPDDGRPTPELSVPVPSFTPVTGGDRQALDPRQQPFHPQHHHQHQQHHQQQQQQSHFSHHQSRRSSNYAYPSPQQQATSPLLQLYPPQPLPVYQPDIASPPKAPGSPQQAEYNAPDNSNSNTTTPVGSKSAKDKLKSSHTPDSLYEAMNPFALQLDLYSNLMAVNGTGENSELPAQLAYEHMRQSLDDLGRALGEVSYGHYPPGGPEYSHHNPEKSSPDTTAAPDSTPLAGGGFTLPPAFQPSTDSHVADSSNGFHRSDNSGVRKLRPKKDEKQKAKNNTDSKQDGFETVRRKKQLGERCADGLFCSQRLSCKSAHSKDEIAYFRNPLSKTKMCTRKLGGICNKNPDDCPFAHSVQDTRCTKCRQRGHLVGECENTKTKPCRRKDGGVCDRNPKLCSFAHSAEDARCTVCKKRGHYTADCPDASPAPDAQAAATSTATATASSAPASASSS